MHTSSMTTHADVLLKTAVSTICDDGRYADANILMDEGAQKSFITQKMADQLKLQRDGSDVIYLSSFGDPTHTVKRLDTATVYVVATDGDSHPGSHHPHHSETSRKPLPTVRQQFEVPARVETRTSGDS